MNDRVRGVWAGRCMSEYVTGARAVELAKDLMLVGVSPDTLTRALRVADDEIRHSVICRELYEHAGGKDLGFQLHPDQVFNNEPADLPPLLRCLVMACRNLAISETVAVAMYRELRSGSTEPKVAEAMVTFLKDDAFHSSFGWDLTDELLAMGGEEARRWLAGVAPRFVEELDRFYAQGKRSGEPPMNADEIAWGMLSPDTYADVCGRSLREQVVPRLQERGLL